MALMQLERLFWTTARGQLDAHAVNAAFRSHGALDAVARKAIYRDMYFARQLAALADAFPVLAAQLGDARFRRLALQYLIEHPSQAPALERVGARFADFIGAGAPGAPGAASQLVELARLEWLSCAAQLAPHEPHTDPTTLASERWPTARLSFSRSLATVSVSSGAYAAWSGEQVEGDGPLHVAIFRAGFRVRHLVLADDETQALRLAAAGHTLDTVCAALSDVARAHQVLRGWLSRRWVLALEVD